MVAEAGRRGYGEYRAHLSFMDLAADQFGFNDHALRRFNETIKDTLDPNGIIAPGKSGIWGTRLREAGFPQPVPGTRRPVRGPGREPSADLRAARGVARRDP